MCERLLVVEDDMDIALMLKEYLSKEGYELLIANNGHETLSKIRGFSSVPVIMLTTKGQQFDKVIGFKKGCDDYIVKPFDLIELSLRVKAILRRGNINIVSNDLVKEYKDLKINKEDYSVIKSGIDIKLTKKEFDILALLVWNQGRIYSPKTLYEQIWNEPYLDNDNSIITHMRNLREKIGDRVKEGIYIKTIWGVGYKVEKDS
ncbi:response regulator transcription factor [Clostridium algidicarnis]|uniref:response regulator transcription factor n=1 Tax=Clostridium algidicarnis TaxID=37659 RepID=UPI001C0BAD5D|nr:response regulator transcription factor [Clostridium algidicarnis]MBU3228523.1 response regulator transcription factor [Clostridium algidicarnis]MBU3252000.1 response regulator transcription factor [Clostridium algidicarnis]